MRLTAVITRSRQVGCVGLVFLLLGGCTRQPAPIADTGSRDAVERFGDALIRRDWNEAYTALHPESQKRWSAAQFASLGEAYRRNLGFEPQKVHIRSCEEQEARAVAHIILSGDRAGKKQQYRDGLILGLVEGKWRVNPSANFGQRRKK